MLPIEVSPLEIRQVGLLAQKHGTRPELFAVRKFAVENGHYMVRIIGRGAATVYDIQDQHDWMSRFAADLAAGLFGTTELEHPPESLREPLKEVEAALLRAGLLGALKVLNARVPHRFTAVYKLDGAFLQCVASVDKHLHLDPLDLRSVPVKDSFCQFVLRDSLFVTSNSGVDTRLAGHPYCGVMNCYAGVQVKRDGKMVGSLCHFDLENQEIGDDEYLLLERVARLLTSFVA